MATILGQGIIKSVFLGDDEEETNVTPIEDPRSSAVERKDTAVLGATGKLPEELEIPHAEITERVNVALSAAVSSYTDEGAEVYETAEELQDQAKKGSDLVSIGDYFDNSFHAMDNPRLTSAQNLASMKYQLTVDKLTDAIQDRAASTNAGSVLNWFDRYILRQFPIGAFEDLTMKRKNVSEEFARALAGNMSMEEYETLLDTRLDEYLGQGVLFADNPAAVADLYATIERFGNNDIAVTEAIIGAIDIFPFVSAGFSIGAKSVKAGKNLITLSQNSAKPSSKGAITITTSKGSDGKEVVELRVDGKVVETSDSISEIRKIAKTITDISQSPTASTRAGVINGPDAATDVAENIAARSDDPENLASMGPSLTDPLSDNAPVRPLGQAAMNNHTATQVTKEAFEYVGRTMGDIYDQKLLQEYITTRVSNIASTLNRGVINSKLDGRTEKLTVLLGHPKTGKALTKDAAEKYAENVPEANVVAINADKGAYAVQVDEVIKMDDFIRTDKYAQLQHVEGVTGKLFSKLFQRLPTSGYHLLDNADATNLAYRAESGAVRLNQLNKPMIDQVNKMSGKEIDEVGDIIQRLQSQDLSSQRNWFTDDEFSDLWRADHKGIAPSQKVLDGYRALVNLSDHTYHLRATSLVRRMHANGYRRITVNVGGEETFLAGKKLGELPSDVNEFIDADSGVKFTKDDYDGPMVNVFEIDMDIGGIKYVVDTRTIKPLEPEDALGYNAGGPRVNPEATDFVVMLDKDGKPLKVALSASSTKSATTAAKQMGNLYRALKAGVLSDDLVKANNSWYPALTKVKDFEDFAIDAGLNLDVDDLQFATKRRDENIFTAGQEDAFVPNGSLTEFAIFSNRRNDNPLIHFGGLSTANDNPINAVLNQVNTESRRLAFSNYNDAIQVSLGKKIKQLAEPNSPNINYRAYYRNIENYLPKDSTNPIIRKIYERKNITEMRQGAEGWGDKWADRVSQDMSNLVYDNIGVKFNPSNPAHALTNFGFKTTFFADPFQMLLQAAHSINIVGMAGLDDGIKGAVMGNLLLKSLKLEGKPLDIMLDRMAKRFGYSKDEMTEVRQLFIDSARYEIDPTNLIEGYQAPTNSISRSRKKTARVVGNTLNKGWEKTMNAGMFFFNKGEQITRVTSFGAAVRKWKAQNPDKSILSPEGRTWVTNKEQAYSLNMTNMSRSQVQQGLLRVPTQFYSYMLRSFEGIFIGKDLTVRERMGFAAMVGPFFGMTGLGLSSATSSAVDSMNSYLPDDMQIEAGNDMYRLVKNGPIDALFAWADDRLVGDRAPEVSAASRVSLGDGVVDTFRNYRDASALEIVGGAGGGKAGDALVDFAQTLGAIKRGDEIVVKEKTIELFRNFKFVDNLSKAYGILQYGTYSSKTGARIDANFTNMDALFAAAGIPLEEVQQVYDSKDIIYSSNKTYRQYSKEIDNRINLFWDAVNNQDAERANEYMDSIYLSISRFTGLSPELRQRLRDQVLRGFSDTTTFERVEQLRRIGRATEAEQLLETTR